MLARVRRNVIGDQRHFAIVVDKTDSPQAVVSHSLAELGPLKIAQKHAALRKRSMELHHEWLILRAYRPQDYGCAILHCPRRNVLHWVGPDCRRGERAGRYTLVV